MTSPVLQMIATLVGGALLGIVFFGGLWLTVRRLPYVRQPALLFVVSAILRTCVVMFGMWFLGGSDLRSVLCCLLGVIIARTVIIHVVPGTGAVQERNEYS